MNNNNKTGQPYKRKSILHTGLTGYLYMLLGSFLSGIIVLCLGGIWSNYTFMLIGSFACPIIYLGFLYREVWHAGGRDFNYVKIGMVDYDKLRGLKIGLIMFLPLVVMDIVLIVAKMVGFSDMFYALYKMLNVQFLPLYNLINSGTTMSGLSNLDFVLCLALPILIPLVTTVAYILGFHRFAVIERMIYRKKDQTTD